MVGSSNCSQPAGRLPAGWPVGEQKPCFRKNGRHCLQWYLGDPTTGTEEIRWGHFLAKVMASTLRAEHKCERVSRDNRHGDLDRTRSPAYSAWSPELARLPSVNLEGCSEGDFQFGP